MEPIPRHGPPVRTKVMYRNPLATSRRRFITVARRPLIFACLSIAFFGLQAVGVAQAEPGDEIPTTTKTVQVKDGATLTTALSGAAADTTIVLADGTYSGSFSLSGKTPTLPIVIKAANAGKAVIAGGSTFTVANSTNIVVANLRLLGGASTVLRLSSSYNIPVT